MFCHVYALARFQSVAEYIVAHQNCTTLLFALRAVIKSPSLIMRKSNQIYCINSQLPSRVNYGSCHS